MQPPSSYINTRETPMPKENLNKCSCAEEWIPDLELGWKEFSRNGKNRENCPHRITEFTGPAVSDDLKIRIKTMKEFTVIAIKTALLPNEQHSQEIHDSVAAIIEKEADNNSWIYAKGGLNMLFCIFEGKDSSAASENSQTLRSIIFEATSRHSNVGIAFFPFNEYSREDVFENSVKAYYHALFYGDDSHAEFDATSLNISGDLYYQAGEIKNAISEYRKGLEISPDNSNIMNSLGVCLAVEKDYEAALVEFEKAAATNSSEYLATFNSGVACVFKGEMEKARNFFIKAAEANDSDIKIVFQAGKAALEKGAGALSVKLLEKAVSLAPEKSEPYRYLGEAYSKTGSVSKAIDAYKKAVKLNPSDASSFSALGELFAETGENLDIALVFCNQSIDISPQNGLMHYRLGRILSKRNELSKALEAFRKAHSLGYDSSEEIDTLTDPAIEKAS